MALLINIISRLRKMKRKEIKNLIAVSILSLALLFSACWNDNKSPEKKTSSEAENKTNISAAQGNGIYTDLRNNKTYKTIKIGTQIWMAENLAYKADTGCRSVYAYENQAINVAKYGYLYDWKAAKDACPTGWHLPTDTEWTILTNYLGGEDIAGGKLKTKTEWHYPNEGATNESGFSALPGGIYDCTIEFFSWHGKNNAGCWWSSTDDKQYNAWYRSMDYNSNKVCRKYNSWNNGFSVRCLKNKEN